MENINLTQDTVTIPRTLYDELRCANNCLNILLHAYQTMSGFAMEYVMGAIFHPAVKYKPEPSTGPEDNTGGTDDAQ